MKNHFKIIVITIFLLTFIVGCTSNASTNLPVAAVATCTTANTDFQQLYKTFVANGVADNLSGFSMSITHEYSFQTTTASAICSLGYQSQPAFVNSNYLIEIFDTVTNSVIASVNGTFSATATSYITLPTAIPLLGDRIYKIKRYGPATVASPNGAGRCISNSVTGIGAITFPQKLGILIITGSNFYTQNLNGIVSAGPNSGIPYIDIVFQK